MSHILESGNFWDASMRQKQVIPNLMVNPCEQSWIRLRKELMFELSSAGICEIRLIRIDQNGRSAKRNQYPANNVAKNVKLEKSISRKLLCPKTRVPFIYSANNQLTISFNE